MMRPPPGDSGGGAFLVSSREPVVPGDRIDVEVSFGAHADEVVCSGVVHAIEPRVGHSPLVHIHIVRTHAHRMRYVLAVLRGQRQPTARRHRRVAAELEARWFYGLRPQPFVIDEISLGGTFVSAVSQPRQGFEFDLEIRLDSRSVPLRVPAEVAWVSHDADRRGFGAIFRLADRSTAQKLANVVRLQGMRPRTA